MDCSWSTCFNHGLTLVQESISPVLYPLIDLVAVDVLELTIVGNRKQLFEDLECTLETLHRFWDLRA